MGWIKKFFSGEDEEKEAKEKENPDDKCAECHRPRSWHEKESGHFIFHPFKEKEGLSRRHFLFMIPPAVVILPELIKELPALAVQLPPGMPLPSFYQPFAMSGMVIVNGVDAGLMDWSTLTLTRDGKVEGLFDIERDPDVHKRINRRAEAIQNEITFGIRDINGKRRV